DEPGGLTGVSHALEHLMFKGTEKYPTGVFSKIIADLGGQKNAFTSYDYTAYFEKIAASQLPVVFELEADRMQNLLLDEKEFAKEMNVIREERRLRTDDNPQALTMERYLATAHLSDPYHHPVIGWMGDLKNMSVRDAKAWYQNFYSPNNAVLVVVGDVKPEKIYDLAQVYFGKLPKQPHFTRKAQTEPVSLGTKSITIKAPAKLPMLMFGYTVPSVKTAKEAWEPYALEIIAGILDSGESSRFAKNLVRGSRVANNAGVYYNLYSRYQTQFILYGIPAQYHNLVDLKATMLKEITRLQKEPIGEKELKRIKTQIITQKTYEKDSILVQAMELGLLETLGLNAEKASDYMTHIEAVTPAQLQETAKRYFTPNALTEAQLFPDSTEGDRS
ncbi:MAG: insulinase family protein, partial [Mycobacteriaceae bacterium]|nr:insulinase family protein [Mycobacteriaceae bacterium]